MSSPFFTSSKYTNLTAWNYYITTYNFIRRFYNIPIIIFNASQTNVQFEIFAYWKKQMTDLLTWEMAVKFFDILNNFDAIFTQPKNANSWDDFFFYLECHFSERFQMSKHLIWVRSIPIFCVFNSGISF